MTDLEICKRLAEIEGLPHSVCNKNNCVTLPQKTAEELKISFVYNPLIDKALLLGLCDKHEITTIFRYGEIFVGYEIENLTAPIKCEKEELDRSRCLAIIAKYEGKDND